MAKQKPDQQKHILKSWNGWLKLGQRIFPTFLTLQKRLERVGLAVEPFRNYWRVYGGLPALLFSPYSIFAVILTIACAPYWRTVNEDERQGAQLAIDVIPGLMAFSLGGMAILLAFSGDRFLKAIRQNGSDNSLFLKVVANFFHFLLVQTLALCSAFLVLAYPNVEILGGLAFFLLCYGVTSAIAASANLLNVALIFNKAEDFPKNPD